MNDLTFEDRCLLASWHDDIDTLIESKINRVKPSEWAEQKRILPSGLTSLPGPFRWDTTPYLKEIIDCFSPGSGVQFVSIMKGAQLGFTVGILENLIGWIIDCEPGPTLFLSADKELAESVVETRVDRMIESAGIADKIFSQVDKKHRKKTGDTKEKKEFPGGFLLPVGPNVAGKLRTYSIKTVLCDEVDGYPLESGKEGDPLSLAERRTDAFSRTRKILHISTPTTEEDSRIKVLFGMGDQCFYFVPCKKCGEFQVLKWGQVKWQVDETGRLIWDSVHYECEHCGGHWSNDDKEYFLQRGEWRATAKAQEPGRRSFHLSSLYSPIGFRPWGSIVQEWIQVKDDVTRLRVFLNTVLGEVWQDRGEAPRYERIMLRRETWPKGIPDTSGVLVVTLGADVQRDRIECEIIGWGEGFESWSLGYHVIMGETSDIDSTAWKGLYKILTADHYGLNINMALIDAGFNTGIVYQFCEQFPGGVVLPCMGESLQGLMRKEFTLRQVAGFAIKRVDIQTGIFKSNIYGYLSKSPGEDGYPPGYCHFPEEYGENYFKMLTAEERVREKDRAGRMITKWKLIRERNEALDCRVYGFAALHVFAASVSEMLDQDLPWPEFWEMAKKGGKVDN